MNSRSSTRPPEPASSSINSNSRRVRSMLTLFTNAWYWSRWISTSPARIGMLSGATRAGAGGARQPRRGRSAPPDDTASSASRRRRAAGRGRAEPPSRSRCRRRPGARAARRRDARATPSTSVRARRDRRSQRSSRIGTIVCGETEEASTRRSQPMRSRRLSSTCRKPESRSRMAIRSVAAGSTGSPSP